MAAAGAGFETVPAGSKDGSGAGDNDQPYTFGRRPRAIAPWPFTERQFMRLLVLRGRLGDQPDVEDGCQPHPLAVVEHGVWIRSEAEPRARRRAA